MSSMSHIATPPALGVGGIISESFAIFFRRLIPIFLIGFITYFVISMVSGLLFGFQPVTGQPDALDVDGSGAFGATSTNLVAGTIANVALGMLAQGIVVSVITLMAYDTRLGRPLRMAGYIGAALPVFLIVAVLTLIVSILIGLGAILFIVPGLWIAAVYSVVVPAVVIERAGFGAMSRSSELTKGYRWPILGLFVVVFLIASFIAALLGTIVRGAAMTIAGSDGIAIGLSGQVVIVGADAAVSAMSYGFTAVMAALLYARLREIKDGVGVDSLADVFR